MYGFGEDHTVHHLINTMWNLCEYVQTRTQAINSDSDSEPTDVTKLSSYQLP
jgi:hypothetical protein